MHRPHFGIFITSLLLCLHAASASLNAQEAYKVDETTYLRCDLSEVPQITDSPMPIFKALNENKEAKLAIIVYGMQGFAHRYAKDVRRWLSEVRGVDPDRLITMYGGSSEKARLELWLVPLGATPPKLSSVEDDKHATQFDEYAYAHGEYCGPYRPPALTEFAEALKHRPGWQGYIIVRRNPEEHLSRQQALRYGSKDKRYLVRKFGLPPTRLKVIAGGNDDWTHGEVWLVPPGAEPPGAKDSN